MKKIYTLFSLAILFSLNSQAQLTLTKAANEPIIGDNYSSKQFDTVSVFPKNTGTGQSWNFSNMTVTSNTDAATFVSVASTPTPALFSNASLAESIGSNKYDFFKSNASTFEYAGMIFGTNDYVVFSNLATAYSWPISFGSTNTDALVATETSGTNTINWTGTISYTAAGTGTVTMPGGGVFNNCLMLKSVINITMAASTYTTHMAMTDYEYWSAGLKFPILKAQYQTMTTGTVVSNEVNFDLNLSAIPVGIYENDKLSDQINVFPNPANTELNINLNKSLKNYSVIITDLTGKKILENVNSSKVDVSKIEKGIYFLNVTGNNYNARKTIVITH